ncbi:MAG: minor capsid protein [Candidatus Nanopelagicales bacterium]
MADDIEREVRNLVLLQRFANGLARNGRARFRELLDEITAEVMRHDPTSVVARYRKARLAKTLDAIKQAVAGGYKDIEQAWREALVALGVNQAAQAEAILAASGVPVASVVTKRAAQTIVRDAIIDGYTLREWMATAEAAFLRDVMRAVRVGVEHDDDGTVLVRAVRDTARRARRHIDGIARTATTAITNRNHIAVYEANADVLEGVRFLATLDSRTTIVCASWDGTVWPVGDPGIQVPPLHFNCRSQLVPVVDWSSLGLPAPSSSPRASDSGQVRVKNYEEWFSTQPPTKQDAIIGRERAELFRRGKITFRDMVTRDNRVVTLDQLG